MNKKAEDLIEEILENAAFDRDMAKDFLAKYLEYLDVNDTRYNQFDNSKNFSKLFETLARSNDQLIKALEVLLKNEKKNIVEEEEEIDTKKLFSELQDFDDESEGK